MKKITAFFMALFPFLVIGVLFATGLITKNFADKTVQRLEMKQDVIEEQKTDDKEMIYSIAKNVRVIPEAARDATVYWTSKNPEKATVEKETGKVTINPLGYGDIQLEAVAKTNQAAKAECTLKIWDDKIHSIEVTNKQQAQFVSPGSQLLLQTKTIPSERIADPTLKYEIKDAASHTEFEITQTGLLTIGASANGQQCQVIISSVANPSVSTTVDVSVGSTISSIGFKNDGNVLIQTAEYNLYHNDSDEVITAPFHKPDGEQPLDPETFFTFESSDPINAPINSKGIITFKEGYIPGTYVEYTVRFAGLDHISCKKSVASSLNYYSNVSFDGGYSKTLELDLSSPVDVTDQITFSTYPKQGDKSRITLDSTNKDVIDVVDGKLIAKKSGLTTLTVSAKVTENTSISDKIDVTVLNQTNQRILNEEKLELNNISYYPLRKSLVDTFKNKEIHWSIPMPNDVAELDDTNEVIYFKKSGKVTVTAEYEGEIAKTDTMQINCDNGDIASLKADAAETQVVKVGQMFRIFDGGVTTTINPLPDSFMNLGDGIYMAKNGCGSTPFTLSLATSKTMPLIVTQDVVGFKSQKDWTHYTTNVTKVEVNNIFSIYPSSATYVETSWLGEKTPYTPAISYSFTAQDPSGVDISEDNVLNFKKINTVAIKATCQDITENFSVTSYNGTNGKFSLAEKNTNKVYDSGLTLNLAPGEEKFYYIDKFYLNDVTGTIEEKGAPFKIKSLSDDKIVEPTKYYDDDKIIFEFEAISNGSDTVVISNGSYSFYVHVNVSSCITKTDLYCLDNKLEKSTVNEENINTVYSTSDVLIDMDFSPVVARNDKVEIKFEGKETKVWQQTPNQINLSEGESTVKWNPDDVNTLTITRVAKEGIEAKELGVYKFKLSNETPDITILDSFDGKVYLPAKQKYAVMEMYVQNAVFNLNYFKTHYKVWEGAQIYGKYIVAPAPNAGESVDVTIKDQSEAKQYPYTIKRDLVSKIVLPNNKQSNDTPGLQRVRVFGLESQYPNEAKSDVYKLPVDLYDVNDKLISLTDKQKAMNTLHYQFMLPVAATCTYNATSGNIDVKFDKSANYVYTWKEIFENKFATPSNKNQFFSIATDYGDLHNQYSIDSYASYSFAVVDAVNVYDEKGIADEAKKAIDQRKIVLQTNFGVEGTKEVMPFTLTDFNFQEVYGNGYSICFDSIAKLYQANKSISIQHASNIDLIGCKDATFPTLKDKCMHIGTSGGTRNGDSDTFGYCKFHNFFQDLTIWCAEGKTSFNHIKNCLFFNDQEYCRTAISTSDAGNTTLIENCAFFNSSKIAIMCNKNGVVEFKGDIDVYNFHSSDMFDAMGMGPETSEMLWNIALPILTRANLIQSTDYKAVKDVTNAYLLTTLGGSVKFYDGVDMQGHDVFITADHGSEKAANYLKYGVGIPAFCDLWSTVKPPLPLQYGHSPAYTDEFIIDGESTYLNFNVRNLLLQKISRW